MAIKKGSILLIGWLMNGLILFPGQVQATETNQPVLGQELGITPTSQNQPNPFNSGKEKLTVEKKLLDNLSLRVKYLIANGSFDLYGKKYPLPTSGIRIEMLRSIEIPTVPGMDFGFSGSFMSMDGESRFNADINGDPILEYNVPWKINPILHACIAMVKCGYSLDLGMVQIGLESGVGLGYFYQQFLWEYRDPANEDVFLDGYIEREDVFKPCMDWNLKLDFHVAEGHRLGLFFGGLNVPVYMRPRTAVNVSGVRVRTEDSMGLYKYDVILGIGVNWKISF